MPLASLLGYAACVPYHMPSPWSSASAAIRIDSIRSPAPTRVPLLARRARGHFPFQSSSPISASRGPSASPCARTRTRWSRYGTGPPRSSSVRPAGLCFLFRDSLFWDSVFRGSRRACSRCERAPPGCGRVAEVTSAPFGAERLCDVGLASSLHGRSLFSFHLSFTLFLSVFLSFYLFPLFRLAP